MKKHRKLFPTPIPINGTDCSDFCDDVFHFPKLPPPILPADRNNGFSVSPLTVILLTLLACLLLILLYYVVVSQSCLGLFRRRRTGDGHHDLDAESQSDGGEPSDDHDHPIWLISTVGLQQPIINSITVITYRKGEGLIDGSDCSVCLSEFREHETLRLLPKCSHAFHVSCIDTWLRSHTNCPLCRARIVAPPNRNDVVVTVAVVSDVAASGNDVPRPALLRRSVSARSLARSRGVDVKKRSLSCGGNILSFETK